MTRFAAPVRFHVPGGDGGPPVALETAIGRAIRGHRLLIGLSRRQLAEAVGVPVGAMALFERGEMRPNPALLEDIAEALGVPVVALFADPPWQLPSGSPAANAAALTREMLAAVRRIPNPDRRRAVLTLARRLRG